MISFDYNSKYEINNKTQIDRIKKLYLYYKHTIMKDIYLNDKVVGYKSDVGDIVIIEFNECYDELLNTNLTYKTCDIRTYHYLMKRGVNIEYSIGKI